MSTMSPPGSEPDPVVAVDYHAAEGFHEHTADVWPEAPRDDNRRDWTLVAVALTALVAVLAAAIALVSLATGGESSRTVVQKAAPAAAAAATATPTLADAEGHRVREVRACRPDAPADPGRHVKKFESTSTST